MQEELKRCNSLGNKDGIIHFANIVLSTQGTETESARSICAFATGIRLNFTCTLYAFNYLGLINENGNTIIPTEEGLELGRSILTGQFDRYLAHNCIRNLLSKKLIDSSAIHFDEVNKFFYIKRYGFPFPTAVFRNLLLELGALHEANNGLLYIDHYHENFFKQYVLEDQFKISLQDLKRKLEQQQIQGDAAEEYVLNFEKNRLSGHPDLKAVKRISDMDVTAGYDLVSYNEASSLVYDRFIEVKSYKGKPHFYWSKNEIEKAKLKGSSYFLYLVNVDKMDSEEYQPEIICNPEKEIFSEGQWLIDVSMYYVSKIL